jgi:hypothetical protein
MMEKNICINRYINRMWGKEIHEEKKKGAHHGVDQLRRSAYRIGGRQLYAATNY